MRQMILVFLLTLVLLTAGCVAKKDDAPSSNPSGSSNADEAEPGDAPSTPDESWNGVVINGVRCVRDTYQKSLASLDVGIDGSADPVSFDVPNRTTRMWLEVDHDPAATGDFRVEIQGESGSALVSSESLGFWAEGMNIQLFGNTGGIVTAPAPGDHALVWTGTGVFPGTSVSVIGTLC